MKNQTLPKNTLSERRVLNENELAERIKMGDKEGHNHFVNNPRGTVVTPEIDSRIGQSVQKECLISATDTLMYSGALQARLLRLCFPVSSRVSFEESL